MPIKELDRTNMKDEKIHIKINDHYKLFGGKIWEITYNEECPFCDSRIDECGFCSCGSAGD